MDTYMFQFHCVSIKNNETRVCTQQHQEINIDVKVCVMVEVNESQVTGIKLKNIAPGPPLVVQYLQKRNMFLF
jgi:hypothetical protein